jgi:putative heme-binding domain-containing protein
MIAWSTSSPTNLALLLGDPRPTWRRRAMEELARRGDSSLKPLAAIVADPNASTIAVTSAVWTSCRIDGESARQIARSALDNRDETVRQAALHAISLWRDKAALPALAELLKSPSRHNRRAAAEALGRIGDPDATAALLSALADGPNDRALDHSLTYALIEIGENDALRQALKADDVHVRRAALVALDQIGAHVDPQLIIGILDDSDAALRDSARWIASRHPEWDHELTSFLRSKLAASQSETEQAQLVELLSKLAKSPAISQLLIDTLAQSAQFPRSSRLALAAMAASGQKELPATWAKALTELLAGNSPVASDAIATIRAVPPAKAQAEEVARVLQTVGDSSAPAEIRLAALAVVPGGMKKVSGGQLDILLASIDREQPSSLRGTAADVLSKARLTPPQLVALARRLPSAGPLELDRLLSAFAQSTDDAAGLALIEALGSSDLRAALTVDAVKQRLAKYGPKVQAEAARLYAAINADYEQQSERLEAALASLPAGDIRRGQAIFNSTRVSCRNCHTIGYVGGKIGPDLTRIGQIRQPRDLVESILFPSASFVRSYEPILVRTTDGQVHSGNIKKDAPDEIILTLAADKEVRLAREEIDALLPGKVSIMPAGLEKQLSLQELADLVEFLKNCK